MYNELSALIIIDHLHLPLTPWCHGRAFIWIVGDLELESQPYVNKNCTKCFTAWCSALLKENQGSSGWYWMSTCTILTRYHVYIIEIREKSFVSSLSLDNQIVTMTHRAADIFCTDAHTLEINISCTFLYQKIQLLILQLDKILSS